MIEIILFVWIGMQLDAPGWYTVLLTLYAVGKALKLFVCE